MFFKTYVIFYVSFFTMIPTFLIFYVWWWIDIFKMFKTKRKEKEKYITFNLIPITQQIIIVDVGCFHMELIPQENIWIYNI